MKIRFRLNGAEVSAEVEPMQRLLDVLRERFEMTGTKEGCGEGECGACTVLLDDEPVLSCLVPVLQCDDREVTTVEQIALEPGARSLLERFVREGGSQCGACTPGIVMTAWCLKRDGRSLDRETVTRALAGNLCRCTGYEAILRGLVDEGTDEETNGGNDRRKRPEETTGGNDGRRTTGADARMTPRPPGQKGAP